MRTINIGDLVEFRPPRIAMSFMLVAVAAHFMLALPLHPTLPAAAAVAGLAGFTLMVRAWGLFKVVDTAICPTATSTSLVTHDVFSISRNPMYLGMSLMFGALAFAMGTAPFYVAAIGYAVVLDRVFCRYEEQKALAEFGEEYATYTRRVRRWL